MVNAIVPAALAFAGTALMSVAIFGPSRRIGTHVTASWPALVEASATACDASARTDLAEALGTLQSAWAESILRKAYETEPDAAVRSAIATALGQSQDRLSSSSQSLVT